MKYEMNCDFCGVKFETSKSNTKFCGTNCRVKNHNLGKHYKKEVKIEEAAEEVESDKHLIELKRQLNLQENFRKRYHKYWHQLNDLVKKTEKQVLSLKEQIKLDELTLELETDQFNILKVELTFLAKKMAEKQKVTYLKDNALLSAFVMLSNTFERSKLSNQRLDKYQKYTQLKSSIIDNKRAMIKGESALNENKTKLDEFKKEREMIFNRYQKSTDEIKRLDLLINKPVKRRASSIPYHKPMPAYTKKIMVKKDDDSKEIGAGDLQDMDFDTFTLNSELGRFLGELDFNRTAFALTGDSGSGKTYFSFELANLFITALDIKAKYFSLEEGIGKLTKEKVAQYNLGNELSIVPKGNIEDVRIAAKTFPLVIVDSFNKLNAKAADFENLRTDFPKTLFILIFQKTSSGTMRGGSSIKYDSSATIDVIKRDGERIALMEKGRYGTIGWEYSIDNGRVIKEY
jgi:hypothetical protein